MSRNAHLARRIGVVIDAPLLGASLVGALVVSGLLGGAAPAFGAPAPTSVGAQVGAKQAEAAKVRAALDSQRRRLAAGIARVEKVSADLQRTQQAAEAERARLDSLVRLLGKRQRQLNAFVVSTYRYGEADAVAALLGAISFEDFVSHLRYMELLGASRAEVVAWVKRARAKSRGMAASLSAQTGRLESARSDAQDARASIQEEMASQRRALDSLSEDVNRLVAMQERARPAPAVATAPEYDGPAGGSDWMSAASLAPGAWATIEGRSGRYLVPAGVPGTYRSTGVSWRAEASQYSTGENGTGTSSGRPLNDGELTCAHKTLPMGTLIAISHGGSRAIVVVTDRGPFSPPGRDIDLSLAAAHALGIDGVGQIHEEIVTPVR